jgi:hypothetical protein
MIRSYAIQNMSEIQFLTRLGALGWENVEKPVLRAVDLTWLFESQHPLSAPLKALSAALDTCSTVTQEQQQLIFQLQQDGKVLQVRVACECILERLAISLKCFGCLDVVVLLTTGRGLGRGSIEVTCGAVAGSPDTRVAATQVVFNAL